MSIGFSSAVIIGNLVADPDKLMGDGARFRVAVNRLRKKEETVSYFTCICFDKTAEAVLKYKQKGDQVMVQGELAENRWIDRDGNSRSSMEIIAHTVKFLGTPKKEEEDVADSVVEEDDDGVAF